MTLATHQRWQVEGLPLFQALPDLAPSRYPGAATSQAAAGAIRNLTARHRAVYEALRRLPPRADFELEADYDQFAAEAWYVPQTGQSLRSRRAMLAHPHYGLVVDTGRRIESPNGGHGCTVWEAVDEDRAARLFASSAE